ncbi:hypothetical protein NE562_09175 [Butyricicoccus faecihominis]|uniref:hypothetical protein n=1 Tax=Butyricicoccus faecihominis TaxID=1712515 RepID=UPI00247A7636|nr:hypothetical protein [Butyricicoccus faecihominis]MCQ5129830.1 hypothetical protein [Butyricicoccus faecihominis]
MKVTYLGKGDTSFTDQKTGELVEGMRIFYAYADPHVDGMASAKFFIKKGSQVRLPDGLKPNDSLNLEFNQYGKVCSLYK